MLAAGLKAGIVMGFVLILLAVFWFVGAAILSPDVSNLFSCLVFIFTLGLWFVSGVLAARWGGASLTSGGSSAGAGAIAGAVSSAFWGLPFMCLLALAFLAIGPQVTGQLPPEALEQLRQVGISPQEFQGYFGVAVGIFFVLCCIILPLIAAVMGAIGGLIGHRPKQQQPAVSS
ncbi:MAG: hypothetical protein HYX86_05300 [Chloroflexi bacterium]|nr:hypothetical protein [Chloroflexota bacterium]